MSIWYTLVWLTGAWCTALVVLRRSSFVETALQAPNEDAAVPPGEQLVVQRIDETGRGKPRGGVHARKFRGPAGSSHAKA